MLTQFHACLTALLVTNSIMENHRNQALSASQLVEFARIARRCEVKKSRLHHLRRRRDFAWSLLLELYIADQEGYRLLSTQVALEAGVSQSSGQRWLVSLVDRGYVTKSPVRGVSRAHFVKISSKGRLVIEKYLFEVFF